MGDEPRVKLLKRGGKFVRYKLLDFYPESLEKAVEEARYTMRLPVYLIRRRGKWLVKVWSFPWPRVALVTDGEVLEIRSKEGAEVFDEYCQRVRRQEPVRELIRDLLFARMMEQEFEGGP